MKAERAEEEAQQNAAANGEKSTGSKKKPAHAVRAVEDGDEDSSQ
jgi:hypothetical protein